MMMKTDAFIRRIDSSGSVILPVDYRRSLQIEEGDQLEIKIRSELENIRVKHAYAGKPPRINSIHHTYAETVWKRPIGWLIIWKERESI